MFYIDEEFKCHASNPDAAYRKIDKDLFKGMCDEFIEGHRFVPEGESYIGEDGTVYSGEMKTVWKDYNELDAAQREYERKKLADAENALAILLGGGV
jgi:hypothetical protein